MPAHGSKAIRGVHPAATALSSTAVPTSPSSASDPASEAAGRAARRASGRGRRPRAGDRAALRTDAVPASGPSTPLNQAAAGRGSRRAARRAQRLGGRDLGVQRLRGGAQRPAYAAWIGTGLEEEGAGGAPALRASRRLAIRVNGRCCGRWSAWCCAGAPRVYATSPYSRLHSQPAAAAAGGGAGAARARRRRPRRGACPPAAAPAPRAPTRRRGAHAGGQARAGRARPRRPLARARAGARARARAPPPHTHTHTHTPTTMRSDMVFVDAKQFARHTTCYDEAHPRVLRTCRPSS